MPATVLIKDAACIYRCKLYTTHTTGNGRAGVANGLQCYPAIAQAAQNIMLQWQHGLID
jgi:dihydroorotase